MFEMDPVPGRTWPVTLRQENEMSIVLFSGRPGLSCSASSFPLLLCGATRTWPSLTFCPKWKHPQILPRYRPLHLSAIQISRPSRNHPHIPQLLCHNSHTAVSVISYLSSSSAHHPSLSAATPAFGRLAAVEARLEGEYRRGVGRVGRESEQVA